MSFFNDLLISLVGGKGKMTQKERKKDLDYFEKLTKKRCDGDGRSTMKSKHGTLYPCALESSLPVHILRKLPNLMVHKRENRCALIRQRGPWPYVKKFNRIFFYIKSLLSRSSEVKII